ncbi:hypothetical protein M440DRAFT_109728 [Trichoderma longibrachiatum ATCC 18648]|uniref:Uncharacterized protein n=1 Tax=Trichoderma longibrachiatum ATCC 18648 TaxID=983965 RepID=A0A2T4BXV2_TRILO|nr:hypothetical protein M440DRAFT_109728 [Trichoderma longibrachiatum ATCC 18648]
MTMRFKATRPASAIIAGAHRCNSAQHEPMMLLATVYSRSRSATMRLSTSEVFAFPLLAPLLPLALSLSLSLSLSTSHSVFSSLICISPCCPLAIAFYSCQHLDVVAVARNAAHAYWVSSHVDWRLRLWQDIRNAQGCILHDMRSHGFMAPKKCGISVCFWEL